MCEPNPLVVFSRCTKCGRGFVCLPAEVGARIAKLGSLRDPFNPSMAYQRQWRQHGNFGRCGGMVEALPQPVPIHDYAERVA